MPSKKILDEKAKKVSEIKDMIKAAKSVVIMDYSGITVAQDTELRNAFRAAGCKYHVFKNRLAKIALNDLGYTQFDEALNGTTSIAMGLKDLAAPAKIALDKSSAFKKMKLKCGLVDGTFLDENGVKSLATLPPREVLIAQLLGMLQAPISGLARAIDAIAQKQA